MHTTFGDSRPAYTRARRLLLMIALVATLGFSLAPMQVALAAGADNLAAATPLTPPLSGDTTNTTSATRDAGEIGGGGGTCNFPLSGNTHSVWYKYAPAASGFLSVDTFTSNYDTVLEVFTGPASPTFATLTSIACNDDSGSTTQSALTFQATTGTNYYIVVRSYGGGAGGTLKFSASFASQHNIYVNQATGNNANPGTAARPVKTIQQGVNLAFPSGSIINIVTAGAYAESVTIGKSLTLKPTAGAVTANSFTLASGAIIALASNPISAPNVTVQAGARIPDGVTLASTSGTVSVGNGTFAQNVTIAKNLTLRAINEGLATIQPASGDAITLSGGTVTLRGFAISAAGGAGVRISGGTGPTITRNNITGSLSGVVNTTASAANGTQNFWGAASGPTHPSNPGGTGNSVSNNVSYRPWCTTPVPACNPQAGIATRLVFNPSPSDSQATVAFPTQPVVEAQDSFGNVDTSYSGNVTLAILNNPGGGTLAGATSVAVVNGKAMFSGLSINKIGVGYTLRATSGSLTAGDSAPFNITAGPAAQLVFTTSPSDSTAGVAFPTQPVVQALDAGGNLATTFNGPVTVAITPGSGTAGATLAPPANLTVSAVNGVATFSGLNINLAGTAYRLTASSAGLTSADSNTFNITAGPATQLAFSTSPGNTPAGVAFATQPVVQALDANGNLATTFSGAVTLSIKPGTGTVGAVLGGILTVNAVGGVATFSGLNIDRIGTAYQLTASAAGLTGADSAAFNITADRLVFTTSPSNSTAGAAFPTQPAVHAVDSFGTLDTNFSGAVTVAIKPGTGTAGATLGGTVTVNAAAGVATFSGLNIDLVGTAYQLIATSGPINSTAAGDSAPFNITAGPAAQLVFTTSPSDSTAGVAFPTQPVVQALDAGGNLATTFNGPVTVAITPGSGTAGATLAPPANLTVSAVNGVATFSGLNINLAGTAYRLTASSAGLTSADSNTFNIDKMSATVTLSNLNFTYDGNPHSATATTSPPGLTVVLTYTGTTVTYGPTTTPPTNAGSYEVQADIHDPNYQGSATAALTINKATATITLSNLNVTYDGNPHSATATTSPPGLAVDFTYNGSPRAPVNAGSYAVVATIANPNYQGSANGTLVIAKASQTITFGTLANKAYGDPDFTVTATASSGLTVIFSASGNCTITGALVHITGAGSCTITASQPGDTNYNAATPVQRSFTISKGNQTITFGLLADRSIATPTFTISATASSNLTVVFSAAGQCSVSGTTVTLTALGSCTITASQPGDANWNAAAPVARTFQIVNVFRSYLPMLQFGPKPDLVGSISLTPNSLAPNSPVLIAVTVTNRGSQPASQFWVDFYINPSTPPSDTNQRWDKRCGLTPCYGIAWYVTQTVEPGQSITLTSTPDSYFAANTRWRGQFAQGTSDLYVYVDSWNPTVATGAVDELNETNNRAEYHGQPASAAIGAPLDGPVAPDTRRDEELPERPVRP